MAISPGNKKLGKRSIPNFSLPMEKTCQGRPCYEKCYAQKAWRQYKEVRHSWNENWDDWRFDPSALEEKIDAYLDKRKPKYFRWFVGGDIPGQQFYNMMARIAHRHPDTRFLAFTKAHNLDFSYCPENLAIIASMWPGHYDPSVIDKPGISGLAWVQDGTETRIPVDEPVLECPGNCDTCAACWGLHKVGVRHVVFDLH